MANGGPVLVVSSSRQPHELFAFAAQALLGVAYLVTVPAPASLSALVPGWLALLWSAGLLVAGVVGLTSARLRVSGAALMLEHAALVISTGMLFLIGGASVVVNGARAAFGIAMIAAWAGANIWRIRQIRHDLKKIRNADGR